MSEANCQAGLCIWIDGNVKQADRFCDAQPIGWCWQHSESRDVLHLLLCTVNTKAAVATALRSAKRYVRCLMTLLVC